MNLEDLEPPITGNWIYFKWNSSNYRVKIIKFKTLVKSNIVQRNMMTLKSLKYSLFFILRALMLQVNLSMKSYI